MPVPEAFFRLSREPAFWSAVLSRDVAGPAIADGAGPAVDGAGSAVDGAGPAFGGVAASSPAAELPAELRVSLPVTGGYGLVLDLDLVHGGQALGLRGPASSEPEPLGRIVPGGPPPAVLTFAELELCCRVVALEEPRLPHPGLVMALLGRFAPLTADDDEIVWRGVLAAAYRSLRRAPPPAGPPVGPEQEPLPLFADDRWWPRPPREGDRLLSDDEIADLTAPPGTRTTPPVCRTNPGERAPAPVGQAGLAELLRRARRRLATMPHEQFHHDARVLSLARRIAAAADLGPVGDLLGVLTEAGCDHPTVLDALSESLVPIEAWWMVETLAVLEPGTLLGGPRHREPDSSPAAGRGRSERPLPRAGSYASHPGFPPAQARDL